ncbi:MAG: iron-containing alcohol dehydrogenase [Planctomycetaceae bacterium]
MPGQIFFGWGRRDQLPQVAARIAKRAWIVSGSNTLNTNGVIDGILASLHQDVVQATLLTTICHEPEVRDVDDVTAKLLLSLSTSKPSASDVIIAVGGGSAIDLAKAVAAMATNREGSSVVDYLEGVGRGFQLHQMPLPVIAVPTTAGTGSEATKNAVISSYDPPFKKSLRAETMVPRCVIWDPELTVSCPPSVTAHSGMDAITQLIESYISRRSAPIPRGLVLSCLPGAFSSIVTAVEQPTDRAAREQMAQAAFLSGVSLANSGLGLAHGVAAAFGSLARVPHGLACAMLLPTALKANRDVSKSDLALLSRVGLQRTFADESDAVDALIGHVESLLIRLKIPRRLSEIGVTASMIPALVQGSHGNSLSGNPRDIGDDELSQILKEIL